MIAFVRILVLVLVLIASPMAAPLARADESKAPPLPAASRYYPMVGHWTGKGRLSETGQEPVALSLSLSCDKAASGWAVRCEMEAKGDKVTMREVDLMGVDPVTGRGHWYAITNQGETHDHLTRWIDARTMKARHSWTQDGKRMRERITVRFPAKTAMTFNSVTSADGKVIVRFSGKLAR